MQRKLWHSAGSTPYAHFRTYAEASAQPTRVPITRLMGIGRDGKRSWWSSMPVSALLAYIGDPAAGGAERTTNGWTEVGTGICQNRWSTTVSGT